MPLQDVTIDINIASVAGFLGFGKPLIVGEKAEGHPYTNYSSLEDLAVDFDDTTQVYQKAAALLAQPNRPAVFAVAAYDTLAAGSAAGVVETVIDEDWYFLITTSNDVIDVESAADAIEGTTKMYSAQVATLTDLQQLKTKNYDRTFVAVHDVAGEHVDAANVGENGNKDVGSITWKFKSLVGITPRTLSAAEVQDIHDAGGYAYVRKSGKNQTSDGIVVSGEFVDAIHGKDWVKVNGENAIQSVLQNSPKVPFDNAGIGQLEAALLNVLQQGFAQGIVGTTEDGLPDYTTNFPTREQTQAADRASRTYRGATFEFSLQGAIHKSRITGTINI